MRQVRNQRSNERTAIAANLKRIRGERGYSQRMLADLAGVSALSILFWERGRHMPNRGSLALVAEALSVSVDEITGESNHEM